MNEKTKNILIIVLIIIICILIFALVFALGIKVGRDGELKCVEQIVENENNKEENQVPEEIKVIDYINKSLDKNMIDKSILQKYTVCGELATERELGTVEVKLPMLDSKKAGAKAFNKMLQEKYADTIEMLNPDSDVYKQLDPNDSKKIAGVFGHYSINYMYYNSDNYISVLVTHSGGMLCGSGGGNEFSHIYDIQNDKHLTNEDVLKKFNISKEQVKTKFIEKYANLENEEHFSLRLNDSFESNYYLYIKDGILKINCNDFYYEEQPYIEFSIN